MKNSMKKKKNVMKIRANSDSLSVCFFTCHRQVSGFNSQVARAHRLM